MPYDSSDESGDEFYSGSDGEREDDASSTSEFEDARIRREQDPRYAIVRTAGPNFDTYDAQMKYMEHTGGSEYDTGTNITSLEGMRYLNPPKTTVTSLLSIKSSNRDRRVYPSPYYFSIKTPRIYKNVTKFQLVQISFPNNNTAVGSPSTFICSIITALLDLGVNPCCISTCVENTEAEAGSNSLAINEQGRYNDANDPMLVTLSVPDGNYSNDALANELTLQANNTPPFNIITYEEFKEIFQTTRDVMVLFNEPGEYFYSKITKMKHGYFTKETIMNCYYTQAHLDSFVAITDRIAFNAYYYPVLKELLATERGKPFLRGSRFDYETIVDLVMNQFLGLDSNVYYDLCSAHRDVLDNFRRYKTFRYKNINQYHWKWNEDNKRFSCIHDRLHQSIQNDIRNQLQHYIQQELTCNELHAFSYQTMKAEFPSINAIYKHLESNLSSVLANYHFVSGYRYQGGVFHSTLESTFQVEDLVADSTFNAMFQYSNVFGNQYGNLPGVRITFTSFADYHSTLFGYYEKVHCMDSTICGVHHAAYERHHQYVAKKYRGILPDHMLQHRTYHNGHAVPIAFSESLPYYVPGQSAVSNIVVQQANVLGDPEPAVEPLPQIVNLDTERFGADPPPPDSVPCGASTCSTSCGAAIKKLVNGWYSCLPVNTTVTSLSYRLGLNQFNLTNQQFGSSLLGALSTNFDYFLQINEEQGFNNMDVAMDENYNVSNETTGQIKLMSCKILTGGLGSGETSNSVIQNPTLFENYLGKLDKLTFKIYYNDGPISPAWLLAPFKDLSFNEWEATFQVEEVLALADRNKGFGPEPTLPIPSDPRDMLYLGLADPNDPNNKG
jgi:hypothetical protein